MISIVTPWHNHPELLPAYARATEGAEIVIVDNASEPAVAGLLADHCRSVGGVYVRNLENRWFSAACNQGLAKAGGEIVLMLNNDVAAEPGWLLAVARDVVPGVLAGPALGMRVLGGRPQVYVEGWCLAARASAWAALGGFDEVTFQRPYWEDVDLSWRAAQAGYRLLKRPWAVRHLSNTTARTVAGAYDASDANRQALEAKVRASL